MYKGTTVSSFVYCAPKPGHQRSTILFTVFLIDLTRSSGFITALQHRNEHPSPLTASRLPTLFSTRPTCLICLRISRFQSLLWVPSRSTSRMLMDTEAWDSVCPDHLALSPWPTKSAIIMIQGTRVTAGVMQQQRAGAPFAPDVKMGSASVPPRPTRNLCPNFSPEESSGVIF